MSDRSFDLKKVLFVSLIHLFALVGISLSSFSNWFYISIPVFYIVLSLSFSIYYHRLLAHRSFESNKIFSYILLFLTSIRMSGNPINWVLNHRFHHAAADRKEDPYNSQTGFLESHLYWHLKEQNESDKLRRELLVSDVILKYPYLSLFEKHYIRAIPHVLTSLLCFSVLGFSFTIWNLYVPILLSWHGEWFVNSLCHKFGYESHDTKDKSKNLWIVSFLFVGEGWHNNHHADPRRAIHGTGFGEFDLTAYTLKGLEKAGVITKVKWEKTEESIMLITPPGDHKPFLIQTFCDFLTDSYENTKIFFEKMSLKIKNLYP